MSPPTGQLVILSVPPKPPNKMTKVEREAWADAIFAALAKRRPR